jgi:hypothetical protein
MAPDATVGEKKQKSSLMIDKAIWKEIRLQSIREDKEIGELIEDMFKEKYLKHPQYQPFQQPQPQPQQLKVLQIDIPLPGIVFPANKSKIIKCAEEGGTEKTVKVLKTLILDREYKSKLDLENELLNEAKATNSDFISEGGIVIFKIDDRKLRKDQYKEEQYKERISELEKKIRIIS